ncbi:4-(cytidine 5'-diphospho)-2-C-methyl-D-erythritol kinase [candidate division WOR-3 bacterium]|nr:4-(cytidine 5'-diphospho)-2-C-methyl-D-erythritol kinase [candidate division WOR-3 bacterium]
MITVKAYAKVNIGLKILGKRTDGYHTIETTLSTINLADTIEIETFPSGIMIEAPGVDIPEQENLCYKAAALIKEHCSVKPGVRIVLTKNIPIGGGLGGGSSDAAAVLKGINKLHNCGLDDEKLMELGVHLGADIPFFIKGGAAYARGIGEKLTFFSMPKMHLVVYYPGYSISTAWAYQEYDKISLTPTPEVDIVDPDPKQKSKKRIQVDFKLRNDFERVVFQHHPDLLDIKTNMLMAGAFFTSLSGSGSCLYTLLDDRNKKKIIEYFNGIGAQYFEVHTV